MLPECSISRAFLFKKKNDSDLAELRENVNRRLQQHSQHPACSVGTTTPRERTAVALPPTEFPQYEKQNDDEENGSEVDSDDDDELLNDPDLDQMRMQRLNELKYQASLPRFGDLRHIREDEFLSVCNATDPHIYTVLHFWHREFDKCKVMQHHLKEIAEQHPRLQVVWIDAEKAPFFVTKLQVRTLPTLLVFHTGKTIARLTGFEGLLPSLQSTRSAVSTDNFPTRRLEEWLSQHTAAGIIDLPEITGTRQNGLSVQRI